MISKVALKRIKKNKKEDSDRFFKQIVGFIIGCGILTFGIGLLIQRIL